DAFVLASLIEPFGTTVIEAMAAGRAVIASDLPGPRESVVEGETGLFFPAGDAKALAERLAALHGDRARCGALGRAGRARAEAVFDLERNVAELDRHCAEAAGID
ncbi:MAG TPA: glycosyltransferase, partial [Burkholderiaceae bacterium]|nr:glycosyltransferase [Burkholderiaceae bacterium]